MEQLNDLIRAGNPALANARERGLAHRIPYRQNHKLVDFLRAQRIHVSSYMPLGYGKMLGDPVINAIAQRHQAIPAQVALACACSFAMR